MRSMGRTLAALAAGLLLAPLALAEEDVNRQLQRMNERLNQLEDELKATNDQLDAANRRVESQQTVIERAGLAKQEGTLSALSRFLQQTEFDGWVAGSYWYNTNDPKNGSGPGANTGRSDGNIRSMPFHPDHNSFQVDQVWFAMEKPVSEESRGGFGVDLVFGKTADVLSERTDDTGTPSDGNNGDLSNLYQAYVQYLAPVADGIKFKGGRFKTHIGAEVVETVYNYNISRGLVWNNVQPINHVGLKAEAMFGPATILVGVANDSLLNQNTDTDDDKVFLWGVAYDVSDTIGISVNGLYGGDSNFAQPDGAGRNSDKSGIVDLVVTWDPSDRLSAWLNFGYLWTKNDRKKGTPRIGHGDPQYFGVAAASRYAITESTGFAVRAEWLRGQDMTPSAFDNDNRINAVSLTGTLDHHLTQNLQVRGEFRYDKAWWSRGSNNSFFVDDDPMNLSRLDEDQVLLGMEAVYQF